MTKLTQHNIKHNTKLLVRASKKGDCDEVKRLIPVSDPKANYSDALGGAAENGHIECVKLLIPVSNPKAMNSYALRWAAYSGHMECVKILIPVSDPKEDNSAALRFAAQGKHIECVKLLIPMSDCNRALSTLQNYGEDTTFLQQCVDEYEALQQQQRLTQTLDAVSNTKNNSIKRKL